MYQVFTATTSAALLGERKHWSSPVLAAYNGFIKNAISLWGIPQAYKTLGRRVRFKIQLCDVATLVPPSCPVPPKDCSKHALHFRDLPVPVTIIKYVQWCVMCDVFYSYDMWCVLQFWFWIPTTRLLGNYIKCCNGVATIWHILCTYVAKKKNGNE